MTFRPWRVGPDQRRATHVGHGLGQVAESTRGTRGPRPGRRLRNALLVLMALGGLLLPRAAIAASVTTVGGGYYHTCVLTTAGGVQCWGNNHSGEVGDGTTTERSTPTAVSGLGSGVAAIGVGWYHACAVTTGGALWCWGYNDYGQLGDGTSTSRLTPVAVSGLGSGVAAIAAGGYHTCALTTGGAVWCWGYNDDGELGDGTTTQRLTPVAVSGLTSGVTAIAAGGWLTCALTTGGAVRCWGYNGNNELGDGTTTNRLTPSTVSGLTSGVAAITAGADHGCALAASGAVRCWGGNWNAQLGDGTTTNRSTPTAVSGLGSGVAALAAGGDHTCALTTGGGAWCWGGNWNGELGDGTTSWRSTPVAVSGLGSGAAAIGAGYYHTCAVMTGGTVRCWGSNYDAELGDGTTTARLTLLTVPGLGSGVAAIAAGDGVSCTVMTGGAVLCWGDNTYGQLGDGTTTQRSLPTAATGPGYGMPAAVAVHEGHSCAVQTDGSALCIGRNSHGQLGDGTTTQRLTLVAVSGLANNTAAIGVGSQHSCALTKGGAVLCWGYNGDGELGNGTTTDRWTPTPVSGLGSGVAAIAVGDTHTCALTTGGAVLCWGGNANGQLGDGTSTNRLTPVAVSGLGGGMAAVSAGWSHTCAVTTGGAVRCWGDNTYGELGDGTTIGRLTPVAVIGLTSGTAAVSSGADFTCAVTTGGAALCWGYNRDGELGDGTTTERWTPVAVSGLTSGVAAIAAGGSHACALTTGGADLCWGHDGTGELGLGTRVLATTPLSVYGFGGAMTVSTLTPWGGPVTGGTAITITGAYFLQGAGVTVGGAAATGVTVMNASQITATVPAHAAGAVDVVVSNPDGQQATITGGFRYLSSAGGAVAIALGQSRTWAVTTTGGVLAWGYNYWGQLGDSTTATDWRTPVAVSGLGSGVAGIALGDSHTCVVTTGAVAWCWGDNTYGQLGNGTTTQLSTQVSWGGVAAIAAGAEHTCALSTGGAVSCWGDNMWGELGDGTTTQHLTPLAVSGLSTGVAAIAAGRYDTCALTTSGGLFCWGENDMGQGGDGTTTDRSTPVAVSGLGSGVAAVAAGPFHTCALTTGGAVLCWGANWNGQLGDGTTIRTRTTPTAVVGLGSGVAAIAVGGYHTCALTTGGAVLCWGRNDKFQLGDGTTTSRLTPVAVSGLGSGVAAVAAGWAHTCALTTGGDILCWGDNSAGELGIGSPAMRWRTPVAVIGFGASSPPNMVVAVPVDLNGTGKSNIAVFRDSTGQWWVNGQSGPVALGQAGDIPVPADYNVDGKAELAVYRPSTSEWIIQGHSSVVFGQVGDVPVPGDYNGDGMVEMAVFRPSTGEWIIQGQTGSTYWGMRGDIPAPADYNGDGVVEIAVFRPTTGVWYVMGGETLEWGMWGDVPVAADYNGDGKAEIAVYRPSTGWWYVANGPMTQWGQPGDVPVPLDVDGDGVTEFVVFRPSTGTWYDLNLLTSASTSYQWGEADDTPVGQPPQLPATVLKTAGDFDHDGVADITVFRPSTGGWYTLQSTHAYRTVATVILGQDGDVPVPGDYQGTGQQERAVYRPSTGQWLLEDGRTFTLGVTGDISVPADYDGDGINDIAVFQPSTALWSVLTSASGFTELKTMVWGQPDDVPVAADFDGDGKADLAAFTPATGQWTIWGTSARAPLLTVLWGMSGDTPMAADVDRDGKADLVVYRPSTGYWYVLLSTSGYSYSSFQWVWWGAPGDIPVPGDYNGDGKVEPAVYRPSNGAWYVMDVMTIMGWGAATDVPILGKK